MGSAPERLDVVRPVGNLRPVTEFPRPARYAGKYFWSQDQASPNAGGLSAEEHKRLAQYVSVVEPGSSKHFSFLPTSLASEPLSSSHRLASSTTIFAHRIRVFDFLYQMSHFEFFHIHCRPSIPPSANSPAYSDSVTGH